MHRHELSDSQYARLGRFLPELRHHGRAGRPWLAHRDIVNGILWILATGAPWRDLPERYGKWNTVYYYSVTFYKPLYHQALWRAANHDMMAIASL